MMVVLGAEIAVGGGVSRASEFGRIWPIYL